MQGEPRSSQGRFLDFEEGMVAPLLIGIMVPFLGDSPGGVSYRRVTVAEHNHHRGFSPGM